MWLNRCMDKRETPASIGKHYGVRPFEVYKVMQDMKLSIKAMGARLAAPQAEKLHTYFQNTTKYRAAEGARQSAVRSMLQRPAVPAEEPRLQYSPSAVSAVTHVGS